MGYELQLFPDAVAPELRCKLCAQVLEEPLSAPCGHTFCAACVLPWAAERGTCPAASCRLRSLSPSELSSVPPLRELVLQLRVHCPNASRGCDATPALLQSVAHAKRCEFSAAPEANARRRAVAISPGTTLDVRGDADLCADAAIADAHARSLRARCARLELDAEDAALREEALLVRISALYDELQLTALRYKHCLGLYRAQLDHLERTPLPTSVCPDEEIVHLHLELQRQNGSLGFNIVGGQAITEDETQSYKEGIYVSRVIEGGPADVDNGVQVEDRILEVNGKDLSKASHEEAVEAFHGARDPISVHILRRVPRARGTAETCVADAATQTDFTSPLGGGFVDSHQVQDDYFEDIDCLPSMHHDVERTEDQEYEEVELYRIFSQEKLGLTVCYRTDDEEDLGIYITEIDPSSIAAQDGRIREGDRIMQINGVEIQDREKAVALLTKEDNHHVSLLLAHAEMQLDEGWIDEDHNDFLEDLCVDMIEKQHDQSLQSTTPLLDTNKQPEEDTVTSSSNQLEKDSGLGRTDESTRLEESSDGGEEGRGVMQWQRDQDNSCNHEPSTPVNIEATVNTAVEECRHFQTLLEMKCRGPANGDAFPWFSSTKSGVLKRVESDQDLSLLREELRSLRLECRSFVGRRNGWAFRPSGEWPDTPTVTPSKSERSDKDTSSAYNTAESCGSSPRSPHLLPLDTCSRVLPLSLSGQPGQAASLDSVQMIEDGDMIAEDTKKECVESVAKPRTTLAAWRSPYPYTHIPVHARHYRSYMQLVQQRSAVEYAQSTNSLLTAAGNERTLPVAANGMEMRNEWKVKIRSDGSRYITKRPVRDRLLRERAMKIQEERSGMTTDDDALSELKMGRYWPKEQRKQHLSHAREQRRRREFMQRSRLECLRENPHEGSAGGGGSSSGGASEGGGVSGDGGSGGNRSGQQREVNIIELSHRKMMKKRSKKILDNWMTIQELLAHGSRSPDGTRIYNSLLSVTTV